MKLYTLLFLLICNLGLQAQTYVRNFEAKANSKTVGNTSATKIVTGEITEYKVESLVSIQVLFTVKVEYKAQATYKGDMLLSSSASVFINGNLQRSVVTERKGDHYTIVSDKHETMLYDEIEFSSAKLYFNEPEGVKSIYSESEGIMKDMVKTSDGKYRVKDSSNPVNSTTYGYSSEQGVYDIEVIKQHLPTLTLKQVRTLPAVNEKDAE